MTAGPEESMESSRRTFLGSALAALAAVLASAAAYPVWRYLAPRRVERTAAKVTIPVRELPEGEARFFEYGGAAAVVVHQRGGGLVALSAVCTHLGCIVQWEKERQEFLCPCHAGRYAANGTVTGGPPPRPLPRLPFTVADGIITIG